MMDYEAAAQNRLQHILDTGQGHILAIETSCDETAMAVMDWQGGLQGHVVASQMEVHAIYGGVVPEIASRMHLEALPGVLQATLAQAGFSLDDIDAVAVTMGPGLAGALLCGLNFAKAIAFSRGLPLMGVDHMEGHICANHIVHDDLAYPYVCLLVSGGHTQLVYVKGPMQYGLLGQKLDDAAGEAFDKVARVLGLPYPGGPQLERAAGKGNPKAFAFTKPKTDGPWDFSFSGIKTAVTQLAHRAAQRGEALHQADVAASFQGHLVDWLLEAAFGACAAMGAERLALCGGVSANGALRLAAQQRGEKLGIRVFLPDGLLCTDNGAMIASAARLHFLAGERSSLNINAQPGLQLPYTIMLSGGNCVK